MFLGAHPLLNASPRTKSATSSVKYLITAVSLFTAVLCKLNTYEIIKNSQLLKGYEWLNTKLALVIKSSNL